MTDLTGRACLTCNYVAFIPPHDWAPAYDGHRYDKYRVREAIRERQRHVEAHCAFNPVWVKVSTAHHCGQWRGDDKIEPVEEFIWGSYVKRQNDELRDQVQALNKRLKNVQRTAASRLARLRRDKAP